MNQVARLTDAQIERISQATFRRVQDMPDKEVNGSTWDREFARAIETHVLSVCNSRPGMPHDADQLHRKH